MATEEQIKKLAHTLWEQESCPDGKDKEHYFRAKEILTNKEKISEENRTVQSVVSMRSPDVKHITSLISQTDIGKLRQTPRYYPLRFLANSIDAYRYGFDNASIYYAGTAIELTLMVFLREIINQERQINPNLRIDLMWLINHSGNFLDNDGRMLCHQIRIMRNCYIHYQNIIAHIARMEVDSHKKMELEKMKAGNDPEAVKFIDLLTEWVDNDYAKEGMLPFRFEHLEENQGNNAVH